METLGSPYPKFVLERKNGDGGLFIERDGKNKKVIGFWVPKKLDHSGFLRLVTLKQKGIHPISSSSSSSIPSLSPEPEVNLETAEAGNKQTYQWINTVQVQIRLQKECSFGEQFMMVGDDPMFGLWDPASAIPLNWSDGHIWTVDLDIPIGKSIQYKFIQKGIKGIISWQPGPNRIFKTWQTEKRIIVCEDWENAEFQKIIEEDPLPSQNAAEPNVTPKMLIVDDILTHQEEPIPEIDNEAVLLNMNQAKQPSLLSHERPIVADNVAHPQEKPLAIVANNISYLNDNPSMHAKKEVPGEVRNGSPKEAGSATIKHSKNSPESIGRDPMVPQDRDLVLVPGLPPLSVVQSDLAKHDEVERSADFDASLGVDEAKNHNLPEIEAINDDKKQVHMECKQNQLDEEQQDNMECKQNQLDEEQQIHMECKQTQLDEEKTVHEPEGDKNKILHNDIQWGRRTLQKVLTNFGLQL